MAPENERADPRGDDAGVGSQNTAMLGSLQRSDNAPQAERQAASPEAIAAAPDLSDAIRECRRRVALDDIWQALAPVSRHSDAALLCLELEDVDGLEHHLQRVVDGVRAAGKKFGELKKQRQVSA
jgi:hypothetical protein